MANTACGTSLRKLGFGVGGEHNVIIQDQLTHLKWIPDGKSGLSACNSLANWTKDQSVREMGGNHDNKGMECGA